MQNIVTPTDKPAPKLRLEKLDVARGIALVAMAIYHFGWDLEFFGYMEPGTTAHGGWKLFARCIASSFLFLVGFSLVLAHGKAIRWPAVWKRFGQIALAAAAITAVTYFMSQESFIYFGILHQIAVASLLGLLFIRLPALVTLIAAVVVVAVPVFWQSELFNTKLLAWIGFAATPPRSNDFVPIFPWFGAVLAGISTARIYQKMDMMKSLVKPIQPPLLNNVLSFMGRHSLAFYLLHQPALLALVFAFSQVAPAPRAEPTALFTRSCVESCQQNGSEAMCKQFCGCVVDELQKAKLFEGVFSGQINQNNSTQVQDIVTICSAPPEAAPNN